MPYRRKISVARPEMSKSFAKIADFLLDSYIDAGFMTATEIAHELNVDTATVVRFSQYLGYSGYAKLLEDIRDHIKRDLAPKKDPDKNAENNSGIVSDAVDQLLSSLDQTRISLDMAAVDHLVVQIGSAKRIIVIAEGSVIPAAYNLVNFLEVGNFPVSMSRPGLTGLARSLHNASDQDLLIAVDFSNEAPYLGPALREARAKGITTAVIASSPSLKSALSATIVLAARANTDVGIGIINIEALIFALEKAVQHRYPERFSGAGTAIAELSKSLQ
jgi:DNA-binding MurR/RpiR family transcriptional regulator